MAHVIAKTPWSGLTFQVWDDGELTYDDDGNTAASAPKAVAVYEWLKSVLPEAKADEQKYERQQRWSAVYGAVVAGLVLDRMAAQVSSVNHDEDSVTANEMRAIAAAARSIADATVLVDP